jgi:hypothetical protein
MRLSESRGVAREDFLKNYQGFELDPRWLNRVSKLSACGTNATLWAGRPIDRRPRAPQHSPPHGLVAVHSRLRAAQGISDCWRSAADVAKNWLPFTRPANSLSASQRDSSARSDPADWSPMSARRPRYAENRAQHSTRPTGISHTRRPLALDTGGTVSPMLSDLPTPFRTVHGYRLIDEFYDAAVSGADPMTDRPGFKAMLDRIAGNGVRVILVESPDRFARATSRCNSQGTTTCARWGSSWCRRARPTFSRPMLRPQCSCGRCSGPSASSRRQA